jgi:hypothetical protein
MKMQVNIKASLLIPALLAISQLAVAEIPGISGPDFFLTAKAGHIALGDGNSMLTWGYADATTGQMQYPGPTLIVNEGDIVTVTLTNELEVPVSIVFPGQTNVGAVGGLMGQITQEAQPSPGSEVVYTFEASEPGTYLYQSGTQAEVQIEMGLVGALIVRPAGFNPAAPTAYGTAATAYDREFLYFLTEMDRSAHEGLDTGTPIDPATYSSTLWFINGRNGPDTMYPDSVPWLPAQPYGALTRAHPSERVLMRLVGGGRDLHPFHHHGNNTWQIAQDGRVLQSADPTTNEVDYPDFIEENISDPDWLPNGATVPDQAISNYTITITPGNTYDAIFTWTGRNMNWDIYANHDGHSGAACGDTDPETPGIEDLVAFNNTLGSYTVDGVPVETREDPNSHCKDLSVTLPEQQAMTFGGMWSGSPYLGTLDTLAPLEGGLNPGGGFAFMWHSHTERELTNDDVFPGGMMTMFLVEATEIDLD